jgi:hypothetical protein
VITLRPKHREARKLLAVAPGTDLTTFAANGGFYFQAFNEMNPLLDITTAVTGLLC